MALYPLTVGSLPQISDVNQLINVLNGAHDIGTISLAPPVTNPSSPSFSLASQAGNSLGVGAYNYVFTYVTGQYKTDNTLYATGETLPTSALPITTTSGNTGVKITLPTSGLPASVIAINIYRTSVGGTDYKMVATVKVGNASYIDNVADANRGTQLPPTSNTTGTDFTVPKRTFVYAQSLSTSTTLAAGAFTKVAFDTVTADTLGEFANNRFTAKSAGIYAFNPNIYVSSNGTGTFQTYMNLYKNGSFYMRLYANVSTCGMNPLLTGATEIQLAPGDYLELYVMTSSAQSTIVNSAGGWTYVTIARVN